MLTASFLQQVTEDELLSSLGHEQVTGSQELLLSIVPFLDIYLLINSSHLFFLLITGSLQLFRTLNVLKMGMKPLAMVIKGSKHGFEALCII